MVALAMICWGDSGVDRLTEGGRTVSVCAGRIMVLKTNNNVVAQVGNLRPIENRRLHRLKSVPPLLGHGGTGLCIRNLSAYRGTGLCIRNLSADAGTERCI